MPLVDPVVLCIARTALAILFASAGLHKLRQLPTFEALLAGYALLPPTTLWISARAVPLLELATAIALFASPGIGGTLALLLLLLYSAAIGLNLARGRTRIACGCSGTEELTLHPALLVRNATFLLVAGLATSESSSRAWQSLDWFTLVSGLATLALLHAGFHTALANLQKHRRWQLESVA